jgi:hypothetical protein
MKLAGEALDALDAELRQCVDVVNATHDTCIDTIAHCLLTLGGDAAGNPSIRALLDCVLACDAVRDSLLEGSVLPGSVPLYPRYCEGAVEAAQKCARSCETVADGDGTLLACAAACRECESVCTDILERR